MGDVHRENMQTQIIDRSKTDYRQSEIWSQQSIRHVTDRRAKGRRSTQTPRRPSAPDRPPVPFLRLSPQVSVRRTCRGVHLSTRLPTRPSARLPTNISSCVYCDDYLSRHWAPPLKSHLDSCVKDNVRQRANCTSLDSGLWVAPLIQEIKGVELHKKSSLQLLDSCI